MPLSQNSSRSSSLDLERKRDHYSHWTLRLAFSATEDLRKRFARLESQLFKLRLAQDDGREKREFVESLNMSWETVSDEEKAMFGDDLRAATGMWKGEEENWFKVDWEQVPELVEHRKVLLKRGKAFVHVREQTSMVVSEFSRRLDSGLEVSQTCKPVVAKEMADLSSLLLVLCLVWTRTIDFHPYSHIFPNPFPLLTRVTTQMAPPSQTLRNRLPIASMHLQNTFLSACRIFTRNSGRTAISSIILDCSIPSSSNNWAWT